MVSLTSLLVLASLFSQMTQTIPKTSNLKLIDIWYIFLIVFDFVIISIVVIIEFLRTQGTKSNLLQIKFEKRKIFYLKTDNNKIYPMNDKNTVTNNKKSYIYETSLINKWSKILFPIILSTFLVFYIGFCYISINAS